MFLLIFCYLCTGFLKFCTSIGVVTCSQNQNVKISPRQIERGNKNHTYWKGVYLYALSLTSKNLANSKSSQGYSNSECPRDVFISILFLRGYYIHIGVGFALLVQLDWAMREPLEVGRVARNPRFLYMNDLMSIKHKTK